MGEEERKKERENEEKRWNKIEARVTKTCERQRQRDGACACVREK